jgi:iron complex outermembrane receptor protein
LALTDRLTLLVGARYDQVAYYFQSFLPSPPVASDARRYSRVSPKLGASYLLDASHSVYASVGGGLEVPAANESDPTPGAPASLLNPLQKPILSTSYELGFKSSGVQLGHTGITAAYDVAVYDIEVKDDAIPYNSGRYYLTAGRGRRNGLEIGLNATSQPGLFANTAMTFSRNRYLEYVVDSTIIFPTDPTKVGARADYSGNHTVGIPAATINFELGAEVPHFRALRLSGTVQYSGNYFADDANAVTVPSYTIFGVKAALQQPILRVNGWALRGFVTLDNLTDKRYVGASFLNPDLVGGLPAAFQPGLPRAVTVSLSLGKF